MPYKLSEGWLEIDKDNPLKYYFLLKNNPSTYLSTQNLVSISRAVSEL